MKAFKNFLKCTGRERANGLVLQFYPKNSLCQSGCLILVLKITPEWLDLLISFFAQQISIIIEINWISFVYWWVLEFFADVSWSKVCLQKKIAVSKFDILLDFNNRIYFEFFCHKQLMNYLNSIQTEKELNELCSSKI